MSMMPRHLGKAMTTLRTICAAMLGALAVYLGVCFALVTRVVPYVPPVPETPAAIPIALAVAGALSLLGARAVQRSILQRAVSDPARRVEERIAAFQSATVVAFALRESAGIMGLVASLLTGSTGWCLVMVGAAALAMILTWPTQERLAEVASGAPDSLA